MCAEIDRAEKDFTFLDIIICTIVTPFCNVFSVLPSKTCWSAYLLLVHDKSRRRITSGSFFIGFVCKV